MNEGELRALIVDNLSNEINEKFKTFKVVLEPMNIGGVKIDSEPVEVKARNPREAIIKASDAKGLKKGDWIATKTKSIKVVNEATDVWKAFDAKQKLYDEAMDLEMDLKTITKDLKQTHIDMEQEAEPEGGKAADQYGKEIDNLENTYKKKKAELKKIFAKLDKLEQS